MDTTLFLCLSCCDNAAITLRMVSFPLDIYPEVELLGHMALRKETCSARVCVCVSSRCYSLAQGSNLALRKETCSVRVRVRVHVRVCVCVCFIQVLPLDLIY